MQKIKLQSIRIVELTNVVDAISSKDLSTVKDVRLNVNLVEDLRKANQALTTMVEDFNVKRDAILKPYQQEYVEKSQGLEEEEAKALSAELDKKMNEEQKEVLLATKPAQEAIEAASKEVVEFELSDDKFAKLKEWVEKFGVAKFSNKKAFLEVCDALNIE